MEPISNLFGQKVTPPSPQNRRRTERGDLIGYFTDEVNRERLGTKYEPLTTAFIASRLCHLKNPDLYYLKSVCEDARRRGYSFSKRFWWEIKPRDEEKRAA